MERLVGRGNGQRVEATLLVLRCLAGPGRQRPGQAGARRAGPSPPDPCGCPRAQGRCCHASVHAQWTCFQRNEKLGLSYKTHHFQCWRVLNIFARPRAGRTKRLQAGPAGARPATSGAGVTGKVVRAGNRSRVGVRPPVTATPRMSSGPERRSDWE